MVPYVGLAIVVYSARQKKNCILYAILIFFNLNDSDSFSARKMLSETPGEQKHKFAGLRY